MKRTPLPPMARAESPVIHILINGQGLKEREVEEFPETRDEIERIRNILKNSKPVRDGREHQLISDERKKYRDSRVDKYCRLCPRQKERLGIRVSRGCLERAFLIMNTIFQKLELCGYLIHPTKEKWVQTKVAIFGETLSFILQEKVDQRKNNKESQQELVRLGYEYSEHHQYLFIPTGVLSFSLNEFWITGVKKSWIDNQTLKLERKIDSFIENLVKAAVIKQRERLEKEARQREQEKERIRQEEAERVKEEERKKVIKLLSDVENWKKSNDLRDYIEAVRAKAYKENGEIEPGSALSKWIEWALQQADKIDPLTR